MIIDMIDGEVSQGELAERKNQRYAADAATDDGMRGLPDDAAGVYGLQRTVPMRWIPHPGRSMGTGAGVMHTR